MDGQKIAKESEFGETKYLILSKPSSPITALCQSNCFIPGKIRFCSVFKKKKKKEFGVIFCLVWLLLAFVVFFEWYCEWRIHHNGFKNTF